jgi:hypothetical protein
MSEVQVIDVRGEKFKGDDKLQYHKSCRGKVKASRERLRESALAKTSENKRAATRMAFHLPSALDIIAYLFLRWTRITTSQLRKFTKSTSSTCLARSVLLLGQYT